MCLACGQGATGEYPGRQGGGTASLWETLVHPWPSPSEDQLWINRSVPKSNNITLYGPPHTEATENDLLEKAHTGLTHGFSRI